MNDMMMVAALRVAEHEAALKRNHLRAEFQAAQIERARFLVAFKVRRVLNRIAPALAPRLGF